MDSVAIGIQTRYNGHLQYVAKVRTKRLRIASKAEIKANIIGKGKKQHRSVCSGKKERMRKIRLAVILMASMMTFAACGNGAETKTKAEESSAAAESTTEATEASTEGGAAGETKAEEETLANGAHLIKPIQKDVAISGEMPDGAYLVKLDVESLKTEGNQKTVHAAFFDFDRFDSNQIDGIKEADVIRVCGKDIEVQGVELKQDELDAFKVAKINGGVDEGGVSLIQEENLYRTQSSDGSPLFYSLGDAVIPLAKDVVYMDFSDLSQPSGTTYPADQLEKAFAQQKGAEWGPKTTSIVIQNHEIVKIFRTFSQK